MEPIALEVLAVIQTPVLCGSFRVGKGTEITMVLAYAEGTHPLWLVVESPEVQPKCEDLLRGERSEPLRSTKVLPVYLCDLLGGPSP